MLNKSSRKAQSTAGKPRKDKTGSGGRDQTGQRDHVAFTQPLAHAPRCVENDSENYSQLELLDQAITKQEALGKYLLAVAGIQHEDLVAAVDQLRAALRATTTRHFTEKGVVRDERELVNWKARLDAVEKWIRLFKLVGGADRKLPSGNQVLHVEVDLAPDLKRRRANGP